MEWAHVAEIFGFKPGGLGYVESLSLVLTAQIAGALYLHAASRSVAPGFPRVLAALPVIASNLAAPLLFTRRRDETTIVLVAFNTAWLTSFKALLWALDRSTLADHSLTLAQFVALLLTPLTPLTDAPPHRRGQLPTLKPGQLLLRGTANLCLLCVLCFLLLDPFRYPPVLRAFLYGLGLYALLSFIMDGPGAAVSHWLGIPVTPHFDAPWLSTSIASFWNRRWDLSAGNALRQLIYEPVVEGRLVGQRPGVVEVEATTGEATSEVTKAVEQKGGTAAVPKVPPKSVARQILGSAATFLTSGLVHEVIFYYLTGRTSGGLWLSYFLAQVPVVAVERTVLSMLRRWGIVVPQPLMVLYGVVFECAASAKLFWGPAERAGVVHDIVTGVTAVTWRSLGAVVPEKTLQQGMALATRAADNVHTLLVLKLAS